MRDFFEAASRWTRDMRLSIESRDPGSLEELLRGYGELEAHAAAALGQLKTSAAIDVATRQRLLTELRDLSRAAQVVSALTESEALYLAWGQQGARPPQEYTSNGKVAPPERTSVHWEA